MQGLRLKTLVVCLAATLPMIASAYEPNVTALGMGGIYTSGWAEGLIPLYKNNQQLVYSDLQFEGNSTNSGILSAGGGYRQQINSQGIAGAYLFYDRERSASENYYNVISPGVEYLTPSWQYRLNYYAPVGTKSHLNSQGWAEDFGNTQFIVRTGNDSYDRWQTNYESLSYGADATIGYRFQTDKRWQVNLSPYAFNQTDNNTMMGANAQLNFYTNDHTTVFLGDGYDNENHNRVFVGVSFTFGGHNNDDTVENLMNSPVYRNLDVNTTSNGLPVSDYTNFGPMQQSADNLWYVNNSDAPPGSEEGYGINYTGDGTYENPYSNMSAITDTNEALPDNADIRVASTGITYGLPPGDGYEGADTTVTLTGTQTLGGYTNNYNTLATGNDRPIIDTTGVVLNGDNSLTGLQFLGSGSVGVTINGNAMIDDVVIGSSTDSATSYQTGVVNANNAGNVVITNSTINAMADSENAVGIDNESNSGDMTITNSTINVVSESAAGGGMGIFNFGNSGNLTVQDSSINVSSAFADSSSTDYGIFVGSQNSGATQIISSTINVTDSGSGNVIGIDNEEDSADPDTYQGYVPGVVTAMNTEINFSGETSTQTRGDVVIN